MVMGFSIALIVFSLLLMLLVLMHKGKGGGLSDMFGGGMQSSVGGSSVAERNLDRITVVVGLLWFACIVVLGLLMKVEQLTRDRTRSARTAFRTLRPHVRYAPPSAAYHGACVLGRGVTPITGRALGLT